MQVVFSQYYQNGELVVITVSQLDDWIQNEDNKNDILNAIYHRLYDRYLKLFFFEIEKHKSLFKREFKSGFIIMASSCLLIETLGAYLKGINETEFGTGNQIFDLIFDKAKNYGSELYVFKGKEIYKKIRNGVLHQGETKDGFIIRRLGELYDGDKTINATKFSIELKKFLEGYISDLRNSAWESEIWENCKKKLKYIISNST